MTLDLEDLNRLLDLVDGRGLSLATPDGRYRMPTADLRELLRRAAIGALLEEHVQYEHPVEVVRNLHAEFKSLWPRETP